MYKIIEEYIEPGKITKYKIIEDDKEVSLSRVIDLWKNSIDFRNLFINTLSESPYEAYFWEVKPFRRNTINEAFEFVLINSTMLPGIIANKSSFEKFFDNEQSVVCFPNLGRDAQLIVPTALGDQSNYAHMAKFVRNALRDQIDEFWQRVGMETEKFINDQPRWLSTAGLGVYWLHVRIDSRPKYYRYDPYKRLQ